MFIYNVKMKALKALNVIRSNKIVTTFTDFGLLFMLKGNLAIGYIIYIKIIFVNSML